MHEMILPITFNTFLIIYIPLWHYDFKDKDLFNYKSHLTAFVAIAMHIVYANVADPKDQP